MLVMQRKIGLGSGPGAQQYWRAQVTFLRGAIIVPEIEMAESIGGPDVTSPGFAYASSQTTNGPATGAFDDNIGVGKYHYWTANNAVGEWIGQDFGVGNEKAIKEITIYQDAGYLLPNFDIQYSSNNVDWTTVASMTSFVDGANTVSW